MIVAAVMLLLIAWWAVAVSTAARVRRQVDRCGAFAGVGLVAALLSVGMFIRAAR